MNVVALPMEQPLAIVVDAAGIFPVANVLSARERLAADALCWIDIFGGDDIARQDLLTALGLEDTDMSWAQRFGQAGRMTIGSRKLRAVTWLADPTGQVIEVHLLCAGLRIITVWRGDGAVLDEIRQHFAERITEFGKSPFHAAGILLQLLLGTLDHALRGLDDRLDQLRALDDRTRSTDFSQLAAQRQELQAAWMHFDRYGSAVRSATIGVEAVPGMDPRGAAELNDYAEQVEDFEKKLRERRGWLSDILHDTANALAQRQGEQINRLTLVSLIFLPLTAVTGFFGMNFNWMIAALDSSAAFVILGVLLPTLMVLLTVGWFYVRGFIQIGR
jgi:Mg2+ and Co2+ transporter CorA